MLQVKIELNIAIPAAELFAFISNFENNPLWQSGVQQATVTSEGPLAVGSKYTQISKFLGRQVESNFEVVEYQPHKMVKASSVSGSFPITFMRSVKSIEGGAAVTAVIEGDSTGFFKFAEPLMRRMVRRQIEADYATLKDLLESQPA